MKRCALRYSAVFVCWLAFLPAVLSQDGASRPSSYLPVDPRESFASVMSRMSAAKPEVMRKHQALLNERYDLADRPAPGVTMSRGKPVQGGVRVKLPSGMTWDGLAALSPAEIRNRDVFPQGFLPLPHAN